MVCANCKSRFKLSEIFVAEEYRMIRCPRCGGFAWIPQKYLERYG
jgi:predicted Zn finger-like uncharacterized protein